MSSIPLGQLRIWRQLQICAYVWTSSPHCLRRKDSIRNGSGSGSHPVAHPWLLPRVASCPPCRHVGATSQSQRGPTLQANLVQNGALQTLRPESWLVSSWGSVQLVGFSLSKNVPSSPSELRYARAVYTTSTCFNMATALQVINPTSLRVRKLTNRHRIVGHTFRVGAIWRIVDTTILVMFKPVS